MKQCMQSERDRSVGWTRAMSLASVSSSTPSSVLLHSGVPADYRQIIARPPLFATEPYRNCPAVPRRPQPHLQCRRAAPIGTYRLSLLIRSDTRNCLSQRGFASQKTRELSS
jgi:hypothetical protein